MMRLLFKILRRGMSWWQFLGFVIANLFGALTILLTVQAYRDITSMMNGDEGVFSGSAMVINKPVKAGTALTSALGLKGGFSDDEISDLESLPGVKDVIGFRMSDFDVYCSVRIFDVSVGSEIGLHSVPDECLDVDFGDWHADEYGGEVPVIVPRMFLTFYNFGFASSKGTPLLSESLVESIPLTLYVKGNGHSTEFKARIAGFTERINTILVPDSFLEACNRRFHAPRTTPLKPVRLLVITSDGDSADMVSYIEKKQYAIEGLDGERLRMQSVTKMILVSVLSVGVLISLLAFFLLLASVMLMIEKNRYSSETLRKLGYARRTIAGPYVTLVAACDIASWAAAFFLMVSIYPLLGSVLAMSGSTGGTSYLLAGCIAIALAAFFTSIHCLLIRKKI